MRFGVALPTYPKGATIEGFTKVARAVERLGFASVWTTDHVIMTPEQAGPYSEIFEALLTLAYLAPQTSIVKLGISVIVVPQRNVVVLAKELATLDQHCHGRLIAGVGVGWSEPEFTMLGVGERFPARGAYLDETLQLWDHLWSAPESPFQGKFFDLPPVKFGPRSVQADGPPIWVGGPSEAARRRAGRFGAAWRPVGISASDLAENAKLVFETAAAAGRPAPELAPRLAVQFGEEETAMSATPMQTISGSAAEVTEALAAYREAGASEIVCMFNSPDGDVVVERMERFAEFVMPELD